MPEAVLCGTKSVEQVVAIVDELATATTEPRLFTRLTDEQLAALAPAVVDRLDDDRFSQTAHAQRHPSRRVRVDVVVVAAGTSDAQVAAEAARTLDVQRGDDARRSSMSASPGCGGSRNVSTRSVPPTS